MSVNPICYTCFRYPLVTDEILAKCSTLFNNHYGIWSTDAPLHSNNKLQSGTRVKLGVNRLRQLLLFNDRCSLVTAEIRSSPNDQLELIGHAFYASANYDRLKGNAVWITQLVVSSPHRSQGVAGTLISMAKNSVEDVVVVGLVSSHPHAVIALCNACNCIPVDLKFIADHAEDVVKACNIPYLSESQLVGSIFQRPPSLSLAKTDFFVDHREVLVALTNLRKKWLLGVNLPGHEYCVIVPATSVRHSKRSDWLKLERKRETKRIEVLADGGERKKERNLCSVEENTSCRLEDGPRHNIREWISLLRFQWIGGIHRDIERQRISFDTKSLRRTVFEHLLQEDSRSLSKNESVRSVTDGWFRWFSSPVNCWRISLVSTRTPRTRRRTRTFSPFFSFGLVVNRRATTSKTIEKWLETNESNWSARWAESSHSLSESLLFSLFGKNWSGKKVLMKSTSKDEESEKNLPRFAAFFSGLSCLRYSDLLRLNDETNLKKLIAVLLADLHSSIVEHRYTVLLARKEKRKVLLLRIVSL